MEYMALRACERIDPRAIFGKSWNELSPGERLLLMGYDKVRRFEDESLLIAQLETRLG